MKKNIIIAVVAVVFIASGYFIFAQNLESINEKKMFVSMCGPMADKALDAYNNEIYKDFYKDFSPQRFEKSERDFKFIWIDGYKKDFGNLVSKEVLLDKCDINPTYPMIVYMGKFSKHDKITIKVIFCKEGDSYKIFYIRFDDLQNL